MDYAPLTPDSHAPRQAQSNDRSLMASMWAPTVSEHQEREDDRSIMSSIWAPQTSPADPNDICPLIAGPGHTSSLSDPTPQFLATPPRSNSRERFKNVAGCLGIDSEILNDARQDMHFPVGLDMKRGLLWGPQSGGDTNNGSPYDDEVFGGAKRVGAIGDGRRASNRPVEHQIGAFNFLSPPSSPDTHISRPRSNTVPTFATPPGMPPMGQHTPGSSYFTGNDYSPPHPGQDGQGVSEFNVHQQDNALFDLQNVFESLSLNNPNPSAAPMTPHGPPLLSTHGRSLSHPYISQKQWPTPPFTPSTHHQHSQSSGHSSGRQQSFVQASPFGSPATLPPPALTSSLAWFSLPNANTSVPSPRGTMFPDEAKMWPDQRSERPAEPTFDAPAEGEKVESGWVSFGGPINQPPPPGLPMRSTSASFSAPAPAPSMSNYGPSAATNPPTATFNGPANLYEPNKHIPTTPPPVNPRHRTPTSHHHPHPSQPPPGPGPHQQINYLSFLQPASSPPYSYFCDRIARASDQQASIFLQQKLKLADKVEREKIIDAVVERGFELMTNRFGNWAVQRCLEDPCTAEEKARVVAVMKDRVVELAMSPYGTHVVQKALDGDEEDKLMIVSELLLGDPGETLVNKHASHVWSKIMELTWEGPSPPIFEYVNHSLRGKWAQLACHETGSLVAQHVFENLSEELKRPCVEEVLDNLSACAKNQWGSWVVQHIIEHGSPSARARAVAALTADILSLATDQQGVKSLDKALKIGDPSVLDGFVRRMAQPRATGKRALIVDVALTVPGSQLIQQILHSANKEQRLLLSEAIRSHVVTLKGSRTGAKVIWMFDKMRSVYGQ